MTTTLDVYAALWRGLQLPLSILLATVVIWWGYQRGERRIDEDCNGKAVVSTLAVIGWVLALAHARGAMFRTSGRRPAKPAVRRITQAEMDAEATRIHNEIYANPYPSVWGERVTPMDHDAVREPAPRVYIGRAEVVFPDAVVAEVLAIEVAAYLHDAAEWEAQMRALVSA